jgi:hypothetical protein
VCADRSGLVNLVTLADSRCDWWDVCVPRMENAFVRAALLQEDNLDENINIAIAGQENRSPRSCSRLS